MHMYKEHLPLLGDIVISEALYKPLKGIYSEQEYDAALETVEQLSSAIQDEHHPLLGLYNAIFKNIKEYEDKHYPRDPIPPHEMLIYLMEQGDIDQRELARRMKVNQSTVSRWVNGKVDFDMTLITQLSQALKVSTKVFIP